LNLPASGPFAEKNPIRLLYAYPGVFPKPPPIPTQEG